MIGYIFYSQGTISETSTGQHLLYRATELIFTFCKKLSCKAMQSYLVIEILSKSSVTTSILVSRLVFLCCNSFFYLIWCIFHRLYTYNYLFNSIRNTEDAFVSSGVINEVKSYPV